MCPYFTLLREDFLAFGMIVIIRPFTASFCTLTQPVLSILKQIGAEIGEFFANLTPIHFQDWRTFTPIRSLKKGFS
jgi:hypothetical protein